MSYPGENPYDWRVVREQMNIRDMMRVCSQAYGAPNSQIQVIAHEVQALYEYIDFVDRMDANPRPRHRVRRLRGPWEMIF